MLHRALSEGTKTLGRAKRLTAGTLDSNSANRWSVLSAPSKDSTASVRTLHAGALAKAADRYDNLCGIVLFSDGDWNEGGPPIKAASHLRSLKIPVFAVGVGSEDRLPDIRVTRLDAPTFGIVNKPMRIPFSIRSSLPRDYHTRISLTSSTGAVYRDFQAIHDNEVKRDHIARVVGLRKLDLLLHAVFELPVLNSPFESSANRVGHARFDFGPIVLLLEPIENRLGFEFRIPSKKLFDFAPVLRERILTRAVRTLGRTN